MSYVIRKFFNIRRLEKENISWKSLQSFIVMRRRSILFILSVFLAAFFIISLKGEGKEVEKAFFVVGAGLQQFHLSNDTLPPRSGLLQKIGNFLKFRKNLRAAERERILHVIDNTFLKDSILENTRNIQLLNNILTDTVNQKFDSLRSMINIISKSKEKTDSLLKKYAAHFKADTVKDDSIFYALLNKILPIIQKKIHENNRETSQLSILRNIRYFYGRPRVTGDTLKRPVDNSQYWRLILERKADVLAFYPSDMGGNYLDYNFGIIKTLIYEGYKLEGATGRFNNLGGVGAEEVLKKAQKAGCNVVLTIEGDQSSDIQLFLQDRNDQQDYFISNFSDLIEREKFNGINIYFKQYINSSQQISFNNFIRRLSDTLRTKCGECRLLITIPRGSKSSLYDINALNHSNVRFLINFSDFYFGDKAGPIAALEGENGIAPTVSRYLNSNISPSKLIIGLPYYGGQWRINPGESTGQFIQFLSQDEITNQYLNPTLYDRNSESAFINLKDNRQRINGRIWYNDHKTLDDIYDFILQNGLGGIAVIPLREGIGYSKLWAGIGNKFLRIESDTLSIDYFKRLKRSERHYMDSIREEPLMTTWEFFKKYASSRDSLLKEIGFLFEHPCETEFATGFTSPVLNQSLKKDSTILLKNDPDILDQTLLSVLLEYDAIPMTTRMESRVKFFRVHRIINWFTFLVSILLFICLIVLIVIYLKKLRRLGKEWKYRKGTGIILLALATLFLIFTFISLFLSDAVSGFGTNVSDAGKACYGMPIQTLLLIIISGLVLGIIIMRYLIFPLIKKDNIP